MSDSRFPRWLVVLAKVAGVLVLLLVVRTAIGVGTAYAYYRTATDFENHVAAHPVSTEYLESWLPTGERLDRDGAWTVGDVGVEEADILTFAVDAEVNHGDDSLLQCIVNFEAIVDPETWESHGFRVHAPSLSTPDGMRAVVQVGLTRGVLSSLGDVGIGRLVIDVLLVSGGGADELRVVELERVPEDFDSWTVLPWARALLGLVHPRGAAPAEGLVYQARSGASLNWRKLANGAQGPGMYEDQMRTNFDQFSYAIQIESGYTDPSGGGSSSTTEWTHFYDWNGEIW